MKKIILLLFIVSITALYFFLTSSNQSSNFDQYRQSGGHSKSKFRSPPLEEITLSEKENEKTKPTPIPTFEKTIRKSEYIPTQKVIKSCNLILKSKLTIFKKLDAFLSSPCKEAAQKELSAYEDHNSSDLNWLLFYQDASNNLEQLTYREKEQLKDKLISQLSTAGSLIQTRLLGDVLANIMNKHESIKAQEIEKLNNAMAEEVEYLTNSSDGLKRTDPRYKKLKKQEIQAIERFKNEFINIMDLK